MLKRLFESYLLFSRWLIAPFLVLLTAAQLALIFKGAKKALTLVFLLANGQDEHVALTVLNLVDITLTSALIVIVTISVYENFVARVTTEDLARIVDRNWDPPVTASARLVSIIDDCAQHLGQAAYLQGILPQ